MRTTEDAAPFDAELARLIDAWPALAAPVRRAVLALVEAVAPAH